MSRNGSGVYSAPGSSFPAVTGTVIDSTKYNTVITDIGTALTESIARDGQTVITNNIPLSNFKITGSGVATSNGDLVEYSQLLSYPLRSNTALSDANATITGAQMLGGLFTITPTTPRVLTTDTAVNILAAVTNSVNNSNYEFTIVNNAGFDVSLSAGVGVTFVGKTIISNGSATWRVRRLTSTTVELIRTDGMFNISAARRTQQSNQSIPNNTTTIVAYDTLVFDGLSELDSTGKFTAKAAGNYSVHANIFTDSFAWPSGSLIFLTMFKNGAAYSRGIVVVAQTAFTNSIGCNISSLVNLAVGDFIDIRVFHSQGGAVTLIASPLHNHMQINRVS